MKTIRNDEEVNVSVLKSEVNRNASIFTKVLQLTEPRPIWLLSFLADEDTPDGLLALDTETGVLYVNDSILFDQCQKDAKLLYDLMLQSNFDATVKRVRISVTVRGEGEIFCLESYLCGCVVQWSYRFS
ncbi:hypothetical protein HOLleu_37887 [Holothuria leucospilota]|uniref:Uncharacterized protein n=1 Tax=Holothuria leucospilota TaxID=206669 RepID=A0A9Q0YHY7_HOLLE|nr:hypothetical protein HOLleu_37887 [Holothuria leucospilota]